MIFFKDYIPQQVFTSLPTPCSSMLLMQSSACHAREGAEELVHIVLLQKAGTHLHNSHIFALR